jgi:hypothetical protein
MVHIIIKHQAQNILIYDSIPNSTPCVLGDSCVIIISSIPTRRNLGLWGPAAVAAMEYPLHENGLRRSLTFYILHWSIVTEQGLKWHDIISYWCADCHLPPLVMQKRVLKCFSRLWRHPLYIFQYVFWTAEFITNKAYGERTLWVVAWK